MLIVHRFGSPLQISFRHPSATCATIMRMCPQKLYHSGHQHAKTASPLDGSVLDENRETIQYAPPSRYPTRTDHVLERVRRDTHQRPEFLFHVLQTSQFLCPYEHQRAVSPGSAIDRLPHSPRRPACAHQSSTMAHPSSTHAGKACDKRNLLPLPTRFLAASGERFQVVTIPTGCHTHPLSAIHS